MNKEITLLLKKRSKFTEEYFNDPTDHNRNVVLNTPNEYTRLMMTAKEKSLIRLSAKREILVQPLKPSGLFLIDS